MEADFDPWVLHRFNIETATACQVRPRGSSNPRQKSAGRTVSKSQNSYAGADFQDHVAQRWHTAQQWTPRHIGLAQRFAALAKLRLEGSPGADGDDDIASFWGQLTSPVVSSHHTSGRGRGWSIRNHSGKAWISCKLEQQLKRQVHASSHRNSWSRQCADRSKANQLWL